MNEKVALKIPGENGQSQELSPPKGITQISGGVDTVGKKFTDTGFNLLFALAVVLAAACILISGIQLIISGGDAAKIQAARARLIYSIIGLVVVAGAFLIVSTIITIAGGNANFFIKLNR